MFCDKLLTMTYRVVGSWTVLWVGWEALHVYRGRTTEGFDMKYPPIEGGSGALLWDILKYRCKMVKVKAISILKITFKSNTLLLKTWGNICEWDLLNSGAWVSPNAIFFILNKDYSYYSISIMPLENNSQI